MKKDSVSQFYGSYSSITATHSHKILVVFLVFLCEFVYEKNVVFPTATAMTYQMDF